MRRALVGLAVGLAAAVALGAVPAPASASDEVPSPDPVEVTAFTLDDAQLAWGLNLESSNSAFAPGTANMLGAGVIDPGGGGRQVTSGAWRQRSGEVRIEKADTQDVYRAATWAGLRTQSDGSSLGSPTSGAFSNHRVVLDGGSGTVDPGAGTASIAWDGTFTVLFYSGMSAFTVTDPRLVVTPRRAELRGTLGGWGSSMDDASKWDPLEATPAVLAVLDPRTLDLPETDGFIATPAYAGVRYAAPSGAVPQVRDGEHPGSWPASFVAFQQRAGSAAYWYSSGGQTDPYKAATPLTVSWEAGDPVEPPAPPPVVDAGAGDPDQPDAPDAPDAPAAPPGGPAPGGTTPSGEDGGVTDPGGSGTTPGPRRTPSAASAAVPAVVPPPVSADLTPVAAPATVPDPDHRWHWWLGSLLLLGAAALLSPPVRSRTTRSRTTPSRTTPSRTTSKGTR